MRFRFFISVFLSTLLATGCSKLETDNQTPTAYNGEYGKSGPGEGESCYVESEQGLRCAEAKLGDSAALKIVRRACKHFGGKHVLGTCTAERHLGTCRRIREAPGIRIRYYDQWDYVDAQIDCGETFKGLLDQTYGLP